MPKGDDQKKTPVPFNSSGRLFVASADIAVALVFDTAGDVYELVTGQTPISGEPTSRAGAAVSLALPYDDLLKILRKLKRGLRPADDVPSPNGICFVAGTPILVYSQEHAFAGLDGIVELNSSKSTIWILGACAASTALVGWEIGNKRTQQNKRKKRRLNKNMSSSGHGGEFPSRDLFDGELPSNSDETFGDCMESSIVKSTSEIVADSAAMAEPTARQHKKRFSLQFGECMQEHQVRRDLVPKVRSSSRSWADRIATAWLACWLALAGVLAGSGFFTDASVPHPTPAVVASSSPPAAFAAIESLRVGDRVVANYSTDEMSGRTQVDAAAWRRLHLRSEERWPDGTLDEIQIETLQPPEWIAQHNAEVGAVVPIPLDLVDMGLPEGLSATVVANEPCPRIQPGPGRVVLTTVNRFNNDVYELTVESPNGQVETVRPTGLHKFYRPADDAWVSTKDLRLGDELEGVDGLIVVRRVAKIAGVHSVYNMTVESDHVYRVSLLGVLVHNNGCAAPRNPRHHVFPRDFRHEFEDGMNIPIDDYTLPLPPGLHGQIHPDWNDDWHEFFDDFDEAGISPTANDAMNFATELIGVYGLDQFGPFVPWR
jgi:hypothetical protein